MSAGVVLAIFLTIAMLDSFHFRPLLAPAAGAAADAAPAYSTRTLSVLDALLSGPRESREKTYSIPLGTHQYSKESMLVDGKSVRDFPRLQFGGTHLKNAESEWLPDVIQRSVTGLLGGALAAALLWVAVAFLRARSAKTGIAASMRAIWQRTTEVPWRAMLITASVVALFAGWVGALWPYYHVFGTDQTGNDALFQAVEPK